jgi:hypothetical protein
MIACFQRALVMGPSTDSTPPFLIAQRVQFSLSNAVLVYGAAPGTGVLSNTISLFVSTTQAAALLVTEHSSTPRLA